MKRIIFSLIMCYCLFLGSLIEDTSGVILQYKRFEHNGFASGLNYTIPAYQVDKVFDSYDELIDLARSKSDSFILVAKVSNNIMGVYYENYEWEPPLLEGRVFNEDELALSESFEVSAQEQAIGRITSDVTMYNLRSLPLESSNGFSNVSILSNVNLAEDVSKDYSGLNVTTQFDEIRQNNFMMILYILMVLNFIIYFTYIQREIIVYKFIGLSLKKVFIDYFLKIFIGLFFMFCLAFVTYMMMFPELFLTKWIVMEVLTLGVYRFVTIELMALGAAVMIMIISKLLSYKQIERMGIYNA